MKFTLLSSSVLGCASLAAAQGSFSKWHPAGPGDVRAPCPMLNTLANHGFLPHDGKAITQERTAYALKTALNITEDLSAFLFKFALTTSPTPNATTFTLEDLGRHNILEHDASLSRADYYWGHDPYSFNETVFDETRSYWRGPIITLEMAAKARLARIKTSNATNPTFSLSELGSGFSIGETGAYVGLLGDYASGTARKKVVEYFFENERLPTALGWQTPQTTFGQKELNDIMERVVNATGASPAVAKKLLTRGDTHAPGRVDI